MKEAILAVLLTIVISQLFKTGNAWANTRRFDWRTFFQDGGMPSSHSALVVGLATVVLFETGTSLLFLVALVFALIVLNDAMRVRYETGQEAKLLNILIKKQHIKFNHLDEREGHTFIQVAVGTILGLLIPYIVYMLS